MHFQTYQLAEMLLQLVVEKHIADLLHQMEKQTVIVQVMRLPDPFVHPLPLILKQSNDKEKKKSYDLSSEVFLQNHNKEKFKNGKVFSSSKQICKLFDHK